MFSRRNLLSPLLGVLSTTLMCLLLLSCGSNKPIPVVDLAQDPYGAKQYYVGKGDTLYAIAFRFSMDVPTLAKLNHLQKPYTIYPGQILNLNKPKRKVSSKNLRVSKSSQQGKAKSSANKRQNTSSNSAKSSSQSAPKKQKITSAKKTSTAQIYNDKGWIWPVNGQVIAKFSTTKKLNKGIDISAPTGTAVKSSRSGSIVYAGSRLKGYGRLIIVKHNNGYLSAYAHNQSILVKEGDWVKQGQKIATLGSSASNRPKLHFEIRKSGKPVNPLKYLAR
ncbi:MAG: peptidoglycan DD-metalloendopeptidase family protein [Sinobacterium sp.]|nr:peptidoglycan DD-metalloendopeptidase family protein [Sinobacterium sp.]